MIGGRRPGASPARRDSLAVAHVEGPKFVAPPDDPGGFGALVPDGPTSSCAVMHPGRSVRLGAGLIVFTSYRLRRRGPLGAQPFGPSASSSASGDARAPPAEAVRARLNSLGRRAVRR